MSTQKYDVAQQAIDYLKKESQRLREQIKSNDAAIAAWKAWKNWQRKKVKKS